MNTGLVGLCAGLVSMALVLADLEVSRRFLDRASRSLAEQPEAESQTAPALGVDDLQSLRTKLEELNRELIGLQSGPITSLEQFRQAVASSLRLRERREKVHKFATRSGEVRRLAKAWADQICGAYNLSQDDSAKARAVMDGLADDLEKIAKTTGGESTLEEQIAALYNKADQDLLNLVSEENKKRYRPIPRAWSSGLVANVEDDPR